MMMVGLFDVERARFQLEAYFNQISVFSMDYQQVAYNFVMNWQQLFSIIDQEPRDGFIELNELEVIRAANEMIMMQNPMAAGICQLLNYILPELINMAAFAPVSMMQFQAVIEQVLVMQAAPAMGIIIPDTGIWDITYGF